MSLYNKFGFNIELLDKNDGRKCFDLLKGKFISEKLNLSSKAQDRRKLKNKIVFAITEYNYNSVGIFKNDELIGISFSSIINGEDTPWLGYFFIKDKYRKSKASIVLGNYIINHLYKGYKIQLRPDNTDEFSSFIHQLPSLMGFSVILDDVSTRLLKVCGELE